MKVFVPAALLLAFALFCLTGSNSPVAAEPVCEVPLEQRIHGGNFVDMPSPVDRSALPLEYAGLTMRIFLPDVGDFGVRLVILGGIQPTVEVCFIDGEAFVVMNLLDGRPIARAANKTYGRQVIDTILVTKRIQNVFYEQTPTPTPSRTPAPVATPTAPQSLSQTSADVGGSVIRPPSTGGAGLR